MDQIGIVIGAIAEHRQIADMNGYKRGYEQGHQNAKRRYDHDEIRTAYAADIAAIYAFNSAISAAIFVLSLIRPSPGVVFSQSRIIRGSETQIRKITESLRRPK